MRKLRFLAVAIIAVLGMAAAAYAQSSNSYETSAKVPSGGTKKKPKPGGFSFGFTVADPAGNVPVIIKTYLISIEGTKVNTNIIPGCTASKINADQGDSNCPAKALIGTGTVDALVGTTGQPAAQASKCSLALTLYNARSNKATLYLKGGPPTCISPINQAFDAKWVTKNGGAGLQFTVPEELRHQLGLDIPVVGTTTKFKNIKVKKGKKTTGYFEGIGCQDKKRTLTATFTDENGASTPVTKDVGAC